MPSVSDNRGPTDGNKLGRWSSARVSLMCALFAGLAAPRWRHLEHLDLSGNRIIEIVGLGELSRLRTLNLASNAIRRISGIGSL